MISTGLLREQRLAIVSFLQTCTVPIVAEKGEVANVIGTGTLFDFGHGLCLVTAAHVLQGADYGHKDLAVPDTPTGPNMHTLGSFHIRQELHWDIAILHLNSDETTDRLRAGWRVLSGQNIAWSNNSDTYVLAGCRRRSVTLGAGALKAQWVAMFVTSHYGDVEEGRGDFDLLTSYPTHVYGLDGLQQAPPESVHGLSGKSVWQPSGQVEDLWSPEHAIKIAGIQLSSASGKYIRARSWGVASAILDHGQRK